MASVSLVSSPKAPVLDKNITDSELAGDEREDGELEDGEIDDEGIGIDEAPEASEEKEKEKEKERSREREDKSHRHRKRYKKTRDKRKSKRRKRDRQKHHPPSSSSTSDSSDSDYERLERNKSRKNPGYSREQEAFQHGRDSKGGHGNSQKPPLQKGGGGGGGDFDKYSDYSEEYEEEEEEEEYEGDGSADYQLSKDSSTAGQGRGRPLRRGGLRGMKHQQHQQQQHQQQQQFGQRGRGRGSGAARGRGMMKKPRGKPWGGRGRGDPGLEEMDGKNSAGFHRKRPIMSKEFISQHTIEHHGKFICKYFLEGRCIKGEQCKFEHQLVALEKKKELCKFYLQGYCSKGENCIYMHNEYPCKFFHTGAKCYQGDNCKFSHQDLSDISRELLEKIINTEEENAREDELELEDLRKQGIAPLPKPPPGVGLLPTPGQSSPTEGGKKIPSLFEIQVQPTVDLAQKISLSGSNAEDEAEFCGGSEETQSGGPPPPAAAPPAGPPLPATALPLPQGPPGQPPPLGYPPPGQPPGFHGNKSFSCGADVQMLQSLVSLSSMGQNSVDLLSSLLQNQPMGQKEVDPTAAFMQKLQQQMGTDSQLQSLPPAVQKAIFLHLTQGGSAQRGHAPEEEHTGKDCSDDDDGGGSGSSSSVAFILKTLHQHSQPPPKPSSAAPDPRLLKDPRVKPDPRPRPPDAQKDSDADPRLCRDPRKLKPLEKAGGPQQKPPTAEEDEDGERQLRDRAVLIPLEAGPGVALQDPRCQLKQFSHIRVDVLLQRPAFAQTVVWAPEDLIPSLVPKQEHSINLPLPPLIADAQLNRTHPPEHPRVSSPPPSDPRLSVARMKERVTRLPSASAEARPADPRQQKALDPRLKRTLSLDSKLQLQKEAVSSGGGAADPRLQKGGSAPSAARAKTEPEKLPPYAPRLASAGGGLESPTTILGGISLYDPRSKAEQKERSEQKEWAEPPKRAGILKNPKRDPAPSQTQRSNSVEELRNTDAPPEGAPLPVPPTAPPPATPLNPPAVHNLPVQAVAGLIRPQYTDPRQAKLTGQGATGGQEEVELKEQEAEQDGGGGAPKEEEKTEVSAEEAEDRTLKDVFKTFDPTASPFCQ